MLKPACVTQVVYNERGVLIISENLSAQTLAKPVRDIMNKTYQQVQSLLERYTCAPPRQQEFSTINRCGRCSLGGRENRTGGGVSDSKFSTRSPPGGHVTRASNVGTKSAMMEKEA
uniref:Carn_acyltransf domain-containing protein n=1 Tax=Steinernema glaseri TaxID=37863 RepID=A0A1I7ZR62_9BILA